MIGRPRLPSRVPIKMDGPHLSGVRSVEVGGTEKLLNFNSGASVDELLLDRLSFFLADAFLDGLGSAVDQVLGFFQAEAGDFANGLDDIDLVGACAGENN